MINHKLICVLILAVGISITGCLAEGNMDNNDNKTDKTDKTEKQSGSRIEKIPFIYDIPAQTEPVKICIGSWDFKNGKVNLDGKEIMSINSDEDYGLWWDGGDRIGVSFSSSMSSYDVIENLSNYRLTVLEKPLWSFGDKLKCPSDINETYVVEYDSFDNYPVLEIHQSDGIEKIKLKPDISDDIAGFRCVAVLPRRDNIDVILEFNNGLALARVNGQDVKWKIISDDIDVVEAGAGTRMARVGERIIIAEQDATVKTVDIKTGNILPYQTVDNHIKDFAKENIYQMEFQSPPQVYGYKDIVIVSWTPAAIENEEILKFIPMRYILAVKDNNVLGEIKLIRDKLYVIKDNKVKQVINIDGKTFPRWQFPQD